MTSSGIVPALFVAVVGATESPQRQQSEVAREVLRDRATISSASYWDCRGESQLALHIIYRFGLLKQRASGVENINIIV